MHGLSDANDAGSADPALGTREAEAATPARRLVRARLHLVFLLVRYGGLRLGEVLGLDVRKALDPVTGMLHVPGDQCAGRAAAPVLHAACAPYLLPAGSGGRGALPFL